MKHTSKENDLRLNEDQRRYLADKLAGTANLILGGLVIGQILWEKPFQPWLFILGSTGYISLMVIGMILLKKGENQNGSERA